jgi:ribosomal protein L37AE/L43A
MGFKIPYNHKSVKEEYHGMYQCPICYNNNKEDIIKLRADFFECRVCGYKEDEGLWDINGKKGRYTDYGKD